MALEWKWNEDGQEWFVRSGAHELSVYRRSGRCWQLTITDDGNDTPIFDLGEYPTAFDAQRVATTKAAGWLRAAADAIDAANSQQMTAGLAEIVKRFNPKQGGEEGRGA